MGERYAVQWTDIIAALERHIGFARTLHGAFGVAPDESIKMRVEMLDAGERCRHHFRRRQFAGAYGIGELTQSEFGQLLCFSRHGSISHGVKNLLEIRRVAIEIMRASERLCRAQQLVQLDR